MVKAGQRVPLQTYDRVVIGNEMLIYRWPGREPLFPEPTADQVQDELEARNLADAHDFPILCGLRVFSSFS